jgi:hypothetical protein
VSNTSSGLTDKQTKLLLRHCLTKALELRVPFCTSRPEMVEVAKEMGLTAALTNVTLTTNYGMTGTHHTEHFHNVGGNYASYGLDFAGKRKNDSFDLTASQYVVMP